MLSPLFCFARLHFFFPPFIVGREKEYKFSYGRRKISLRWEVYVPTVGNIFSFVIDFLATVGKIKQPLDAQKYGCEWHTNMAFKKTIKPEWYELGLWTMFLNLPQICGETLKRKYILWSIKVHFAGHESTYCGARKYISSILTIRYSGLTFF